MGVPRRNRPSLRQDTLSTAMPYSSSLDMDRLNAAPGLAQQDDQWDRRQAQHHHQFKIVVVAIMAACSVTVAFNPAKARKLGDPSGSCARENRAVSGSHARRASRA